MSDSSCPQRPVALPEEAISARATELLAAVAGGEPLDWQAEYQQLLGQHNQVAMRLHKVLTISDRYQASSREFMERLERSSERLRRLRDIGLPICMYCKKPRIDERYVAKLNEFLEQYPDIALAHNVCPECLEERYGHDSFPKKSEPPVQLESRISEAIPAEDPSLIKARTALAAPNPTKKNMGAALGELAGRYERLLRRLNKITLISDHFQNELRDSKLRLEHLAHTDHLTGLANRRAVRDRLEAEASRARRHGRPLSVVFIDLDHFKQINDTHGHDIGDAALTKVATAIQRNVRREDCCGRWGGEEFVLVLPDTSLPAAVIVAEKLRLTIERETIAADDRKVSITASFGVAGFSPDELVDEVVRKADQAMYAAKRAGRNLVVCA